MRHLKTGRKFNRSNSHRKAMIKNLSLSLLKYEMIKTTLPKAKELKKSLEPLITLAKRESILRKDNINSNDNTTWRAKIVSLRRQAFNYLRNKVTVKKLFEEIGPRYKERQGGYTRIIKCGYRFGDKAPMAIIELLDRMQQQTQTKET